MAIDEVELLNVLLVLRLDQLQVLLDLEDLLGHLVHLVVNFLHESVSIFNDDLCFVDQLLEESDLPLVVGLLEVLSLVGLLLNRNLDRGELFQNAMLLGFGLSDLVQFECVCIFINNSIAYREELALQSG